jgi:histidinol dehydrogenase
MKAMTVQELTDDAARAIAPAAAALARLEGLEAHARAADARLAMVPA